MAANPVTMIKSMTESLNDPNYDVRYIAHAMMYTQTADSIYEALDIYDLATNNKVEYLKALLTAILPKYETIAELLGNPRTIEDWNNKIYFENGGLKTRTKKKYRDLYRANYGDKYTYMKSEDWENFKHIAPDDLFK